jgi:hypothetical protein
MSDDTWTGQLRRAIKHYLPWPQFPDWVVKPFLRLDPLMSDDDVDFAGDLIYARALLDDLVDDCYWLDAQVPPMPSIMSSSLDLALELVRDAFPDPAGVAVQEWRNDAQVVAA